MSVDNNWDPLDAPTPRSHRLSRRWLAIAVVVASVAALAVWWSWPSRQGVADRLVYPVGPGPLTALVWGTDGWIYGLNAGGSPTPEVVFRTRPGVEPQVISDKINQECLISGLFPVAGAVGMSLSHCSDQPTNRLAILSQADPATMSTLLALPDPVGEVGWDSSAASAYVSMPDGTRCLPLRSVGQGGYQALDFAVPLPGTAIGVVPSGPAARSGSCGGVIGADFPVVSSGGDLYFMVQVRTSPGVTGWYLCVLPRGAPSARVVVGGFSDQVSDVAINHSGDEILVSGTRGGQDGVWLVHVPDGSVTSVAPGPHFCAAFDPSDKNVVVDEAPATDSDADASTLPLRIIALR
jgi:hypothetical protein